MAAEAFETLSTRLCPWLGAPLESLETALAAQRLGHAWLLTGPEGTGKLNLALVFATRLLQGRAGSERPANLSAAAAAAAMGDVHVPVDHDPDLHWIFPVEDKRTIAVEQVRDVTERLTLKAYRGSSKIVILEPAEAMTSAAANALLKSLEEPGQGTYMLLLSHQPGRLPSTIRSRCQTLPVRGPKATDGSGLELPPLVLAQRTTESFISYINNIEESFNLLLEYKAEPRTLVDEWVKRDAGAALDWLISRIQLAIRTRAAHEGRNDVTDHMGSTLHNAWGEMTLGALLEQLTAAERIRGQLGSGLNTELALHVLLLGFIPERG